MGIRAHYFAKTAAALCGVLAVVASVPADAVTPFSDVPLFLQVSVPPNVTVTLDDSGSMSRAWVPEANCTGGDSDINGCDAQKNRYEKAANRNLIYYDPNVKYPVPKDSAGNELTTSFTAAWRNGFEQTSGTTVDLSNNYQPTASIHVRSGAFSEVFMPHSSLDVQCKSKKSGGGNSCQIKDASNKWWEPTITTACSNNTACTGTFSTTSGNTMGNNPTKPTGMQAYYYVYDTTLGSCTKSVTDDNCYRIVIVSNTSGPGGTDERQNFANWYSFARTRNLATIAGASRAFADLPDEVRVAWQSLNSCRGSTSSLPTTTCQGWKGGSGPSVNNAIKPFNGTHRGDFYKWITRLPTDGGTPLPQAMQRVGDYYSTSGDNSPYDDDFSRNNSTQTACRRDYHIMMTDGIWNSAVATKNYDGGTVSLPESIPGSSPLVQTYTAMHPYSDSYDSTLADIAFKYWITDLSPLANNLLAKEKDDSSGDALKRFWNPKNDPATWQHMVNFTIGLGLSGFLKSTTPALTYNGTYGGSYDDLVAGNLAWPKASNAGTAANVADLWHAALNSRGQFFSADNPEALGTAFKTIVDDIAAQSGSSASLSANSTSVQTNTMVFQARFNQDWSGDLVAYPVATTGVGDKLWNAAEHIPIPGKRNMWTYNGTGGVSFSSCSNLTPAQKAVLDTDPDAGTVDGLCDKRLAWLRGDQTNEISNKGIFRSRSTLMGDIINSDPAYVAANDYQYGKLPVGTPGQTEYASYLTSSAKRIPMVYVGSNDGHLYGIRADRGVVVSGDKRDPNQSGAEQFSYIPAGVFDDLNRLTSPNYTHEYYVDGAITVGDAYLYRGNSTPNWKTVLVAGLNGGGRSIYALDVTDGTTFGATNVMWEFTEPLTSDADLKAGKAPSTLGFTYSQPQIGILENGTWVAVFGNGYNSQSGGAYLYVLNLETGKLITKIAAQDQLNTDKSALDESNGLSTPLLADTDNNHLIDTVYAGDLKGNLWKFNVKGAPGDWGVAFSGAPLFTAKNGSGNVQPITSQPKQAAIGAPVAGRIVVFGTGRYLADSDVTDTSMQTFYGIQDDDATPVSAGRISLHQQTIDTQTLLDNKVTIRNLTNTTITWGTEHGWFVDLVDPGKTGTGERVVSTPIIKDVYPDGLRVIFVTITPSQDRCKPGGTSWLMEAQLANGGGFPKVILDTNKDGKIDEKDVPASGIQLDELGISKTPVLLDNPPGFDKLLTGTTGKIEVVHNDSPTPPPGGVKRRSWIQIR